MVFGLLAFWKANSTEGIGPVTARIFLRDLKGF